MYKGTLAQTPQNKKSILLDQEMITRQENHNYFLLQGILLKFNLQWLVMSFFKTQGTFLWHSSVSSWAFNTYEAAAWYD